MTELISNTLPAIIGLAGVVVAVLVYVLSRQQARESWLRTYKELHEAFWSDPDFRKIRMWLACDSSYSKIQPILKKRQSIDEEVCSAKSITEEEYRNLETLDRFLNFLMRVIAINPQFKNQKHLWKKLYFNYWLMQFDHPNRIELRWYLKKFYTPLYDMLEVARADVQQKQ